MLAGANASLREDSLIRSLTSTSARRHGTARGDQRFFLVLPAARTVVTGEQHHRVRPSAVVGLQEIM
jgi:hypothetical protein